MDVEVDGRRVRLTNLDKVLYPSGFTKAEVVDYHARISPWIIPHLAGRCITFRRFPDGTGAPGFFEKRCPSHRPEWVDVSIGPGDRRGGIEYCRIEEPAAMVWAANLAAIELHAPMALAADLATPRAVVFDFDPGPDTSIVECCQVALAVQEVLAAVDLQAFPKTSGSKGLQVYVPLNQGGAVGGAEPPADRGGVTHEAASQFALAVAQVVDRQLPGKTTTVMAKAERPGKVFIDWSQNAHHKTTIAPYSLRARPRPTVSTPVTWDEVGGCADGALDLVFEAADVVQRVTELGDLFAGVVELQQQLPG